VFILFNFPILVQLSGFSLAVSVGTQNRNDLKISETSAYVAPEYMADGIIYIHPSYCLIFFNKFSISFFSHVLFSKHFPTSLARAYIANLMRELILCRQTN